MELFSFSIYDDYGRRVGSFKDRGHICQGLLFRDLSYTLPLPPIDHLWVAKGMFSKDRIKVTDFCIANNITPAGYENRSVEEEKPAAIARIETNYGTDPIGAISQSNLGLPILIGIGGLALLLVLKK